MTVTDGHQAPETPASSFNFTFLSLRVGRMFFVNRGSKQWNYRLASELKESRFTTHRILKDFEQRGWITSAPERGDPEQLGRTPRLFYTISDAGVQAIGAALMALQVAST